MGASVAATDRTGAESGPIRVGYRSGVWRFVTDSRVLVAGPVLLVMTGTALLAEELAPFNPNRQALADNLSPPSFTALRPGERPHLFGTDELGRDVFSRVLYGARISLGIGLATSLLAVVLGVTMGVLSGHFGGVLGAILMRAVDIQLAFPFIVLAIAIIAAVGPSALAVGLTLAFWGWVPFARLARAEVLAQRAREYVMAAEAIGADHWRVMLRHVLPNIMSSILVAFTFFVGIVIVSEGGLSFLGLGVQPPDPSWGQMMAEGRSRLTTAWWTAVTPGIPLSLTVLSINFLGDALTDAVNPRIRRRHL